MLLGLIFTLIVSFCHGFIVDETDGTASGTLPLLAEPPLTIASFNIQILGQSKYAKKDVVDIIVQILSRYDIIQVLEIRDSQATVFDGLKADLNAYTKAQGNGAVFDSVVSGRLGRSNIKEQYGFLYRTHRVSVTDTYQYTDIHDHFERPPFGVRFKSPTTVIEDFAMIANHIKPSMALEEMDNLTRAYDSFYRHWHLQDMLISGDFNADFNYLRVGDWNNITLRTNSKFSWLVDDDVDTTVSESSCSYDRFVVTGDQLYSAVVPGSVTVYRFDERMGLNKSTGLRVSDHYPIELQLAGKPNLATQQHLDTSVSFNVKDTVPVTNVNNLRHIYQSPSCAGTDFTIKLLNEGTHMDSVIAHVTTSYYSHVMSQLASFRASCPGTLSPNLLSLVDGYMASNYLKDNLPNVYGLVQNVKKQSYDTEIVCSLVTPYVCKVTVSRRISGAIL